MKFGHEEAWYTRGGLANDAVGGRGKTMHALERSVEYGKATKSTLPHLGTCIRGEETNKVNQGS